MLLAMLAGLTLSGPAKFDFYAFGPYNKSVPKPESILGYTAGRQQTTYRDQEQVVLAIAKAAPERVKVIQYGKSTQGRPLHIVVIGSPANIAKLDSILKDANDLANQTGDVAAIEKRIPAIVWINECIHGDEPASFEAAMWTIYNLAASGDPDLTSALDKELVIVNPVYNPDGHERFAVWSNSVSVGSPRRESIEHNEPGMVYGRLNAYRIDMNRDRVAVSQTETQQEVTEFQRWHPQVYVDQHGQVANYFFPPNPMSLNVNVDRDRIKKYTDVFGRGVGKAFDNLGFSYYVKDEFDLYYAGYLDSWTCLNGAVGMTFETGGSSAISAENRDGTFDTLFDGIRKHFTSALAVVRTAAAHRDELMQSYSNYKHAEVTGQIAGKFQRVVMTSDDPRPLIRLRKQLDIHGIKSYFAAKPFSQPDAHDYWSETTGAHSFPANSLVVDMAQSQGALAKALLEPGSDFEPDFTKEQIKRFQDSRKDETYPGADDFEFYDYTAWSLPYAHDLKAWWCETAPTIASSDEVKMEASDPVDSSVGWALRYRDDDDALAAFDLLYAGVRVQVAPKPMKLGDQSFDPGTFLIMRTRNDDDVLEKVRRVAKARGVSFVPVPSSYPELDRFGPGSGDVFSLRKPDIGIVFGDTERPTEFGALWYLMDKEFHLPFTPLSSSALSGSSLSKYTCIVFPQGFYTVTDALRAWIRAGGCAVVLGQPGWAVGDQGFLKATRIKSGDDDPGSLPGALFLAEMDPRLFLTYGYHADGDRIPIAVPVAGSDFYNSVAAGGGAVTFSKDEKVKKLLSGWEWPNDTESALKGALWAQDQPVGGGHAIVFTEDPSGRAMWPGLYKLLLNAMLMGAR